MMQLRQPSAVLQDGRQSQAASEVCRGTARLLSTHGMATVTEVSLANGRRADIAAIAPTGELWIVEIKSCLDDFRTDGKWPEYRDYCDRLYFAVGPAFPVDVLPADTGLIVADRFGGTIVRPAPEHKLPPARRKALTLALARIAAFRLQRVADPEFGLDV
jgi:hypothetical protein